MTPLIRALSASSGLSAADTLKLVKDAPDRYKIFDIDKRSGAEKRKIAQPAAEVKYLQRIVVEILLARLPVHSAATAYIKGGSLRDNAAPHAGVGRPILKMDLKQFFPSIRSRDWESYCSDNEVFSDAQDAYLSSRLLFHRPPGGRVLRLAIGAPSSPMMSNILMYEFDKRISAAVEEDEVTYTRYADDLTFSARRTGYLVDVRKRVYRVVRELNYPKLDINRSKTVYATSRYHREVTGLILSNDGRVTIGRDKKRLIYSMVHRYLKGGLNGAEIQHLAGILAFVKSAEPDFLLNIDRKYEIGTVSDIAKTAGRIHVSDRQSYWQS